MLIMKAKPFNEKLLAKFEPPYFVQPKINGDRCFVKWENERPKMLTPEGNEKLMLPHLTEQLTELYEHLDKNVVLDGELYSHGMEHQDIHSITGRTVNLHPDYRYIEYWIFDTISEQPQYSRINVVKDIGDHLRVFIGSRRYPHLHTVNTNEVWKADLLGCAFAFYIKHGYEGIIIRNAEAPYEFKRSGNVLKMKAKGEVVCEVVGYQQEKTINGELKHSLGALTVKSERGITFKVGTGFTTKERHNLWLECISSKYHLKGRKIKVKYFELSKDGKPSPAIFKGFVT